LESDSIAGCGGAGSDEAGGDVLTGVIDGADAGGGGGGIDAVRGAASVAAIVPTAAAVPAATAGAASKVAGA
jgi:hypothetical protein